MCGSPFVCALLTDSSDVHYILWVDLSRVSSFRGEQELFWLLLLLANTLLLLLLARYARHLAVKWLNVLLLS